MDRNKELKVHRLRLPGRSLCSIRSNRKWCKRRGSSLQCQNCFFVYPIIDCNLKNCSKVISASSMTCSFKFNILPHIFIYNYFLTTTKKYHPYIVLDLYIYLLMEAFLLNTAKLPNAFLHNYPMSNQKQHSR